MTELACPVCGRPVPADTDRCSHCGTSVDNQTPERQRRRQRRFTWLFVALVIFCLLAALWLPRTIP